MTTTETDIEVSVVIPCLNEADTLATCLEKANRSLGAAGIAYEIVVADNGSTDGSQEIARGLGARVVDVAQKGYGAALLGGSLPHAASTPSWAMPMTATISPAFRSLWTSCVRAWIWSWATVSRVESLPGPCRRSIVIWAILS